jgi:crotonobetainyl-CoA:carnitine CoA-transferase CaiB-like acyl-CoA transferase
MSEDTWQDYTQRKFHSPAPLKGIRVLEVCTLLMGPVGTALLGLLGAEVIKFEIPSIGDPGRSLSPFGWLYKDLNPGALCMVNKYWVGLDLHRPEAQEVFHELAAKSDIIVENLRPGVMAQWRVGYQQIKEINPSIIYVSKNGFGQWGKYAEEDRPSNDGAGQALSGYASMSSFPGRPPVKSGVPVCDLYGALMGSFTVLTALHYRQRTGKGQYIELSQSENIMRTMSWVWPYQQITGKGAQPSGNRDLSVCPADTFLCRDDIFLALAAPAPDEFQGLCTAMGKPSLAGDPRFKDHLTRLKEENATEILKIIARWARTKKASEIEELAEKHGFAASRVYNAKDMLEDKHHAARGYMVEKDDALYGKFHDHEFPVMMSRTPPKARWSVRPVGFDNEYIMKRILGKSEPEIEQLYNCGALGKWNNLEGRRPPPDWDGKAGLIMKRPEA